MEILKKLLIIGVMPASVLAIVGHYNYTDLMKAIEDKQFLFIIRDIIAQGADVSAINAEYLRWSKPVLRYALDRGVDKESVDIIKMLIASGADVNGVTYNRVSDKNLYGMMPLLAYATIYSSAEIVQIFINAGAKDIVLGEGQMIFEKTASMIARELGKTDIVKILG